MPGFPICQLGKSWNANLISVHSKSYSSHCCLQQKPRLKSKALHNLYLTSLAGISSHLLTHWTPCFRHIGCLTSDLPLHAFCVPKKPFFMRFLLPGISLSSPFQCLLTPLKVYSSQNPSQAPFHSVSIAIKYLLCLSLPLPFQDREEFLCTWSLSTHLAYIAILRREEKRLYCARHLCWSILPLELVKNSHDVSMTTTFSTGAQQGS
jgi:hypothetical protein